MPKQHKNATTTPEMRTFIYESDLATAKLARLLNISESTVRKWRKRENCEDLPHTPKHLHTTLTTEQEYVVVQLRVRLMFSLDQLLAVCKAYINLNTSRAGLQRCLKRHGVSRLADMDGSEFEQKNFIPVFVDISEKQSNVVFSSEVSPQGMSDVLNKLRGNELSINNMNSPLTDHALNAKSTHVNCHDMVQVNVVTLPDVINPTGRYRLLVANDPDSNWVYVDLYKDQEIDAARRYMKHVLGKAPFHIRRVLAGNYNEFLRRFRLLDNQSKTDQ
ncbi:MAG: helix-turn-helix domain-containing protein [Psychromonas sp.]